MLTIIFTWASLTGTHHQTLTSILDLSLITVTEEESGSKTYSLRLSIPNISIRSRDSSEDSTSLGLKVIHSQEISDSTTLRLAEEDSTTITPSITKLSGISTNGKPPTTSPLSTPLVPIRSTKASMSSTEILKESSLREPEPKYDIAYLYVINKSCISCIGRYLTKYDFINYILIFS